MPAGGGRKRRNPKRTGKAPGTRKTRTARGARSERLAITRKRWIAERKKLINEGYAKGLNSEEALEYAEKIMRQRFRLKSGRS